VAAVLDVLVEHEGEKVAGRSQQGLHVDGGAWLDSDIASAPKTS
jgi:hypothetical protein